MRGRGCFLRFLFGRYERLGPVELFHDFGMVVIVMARRGTVGTGLGVKRSLEAGRTARSRGLLRLC